MRNAASSARSRTRQYKERPRVTCMVDADASDALAAKPGRTTTLGRGRSSVRPEPSDPRQRRAALLATIEAVER